MITYTSAIIATLIVIILILLTICVRLSQLVRRYRTIAEIMTNYYQALADKFSDRRDNAMPARNSARAQKGD